MLLYHRPPRCLAFCFFSGFRAFLIFSGFFFGSHHRCLGGSRRGLTCRAEATADAPPPRGPCAAATSRWVGWLRQPPTASTPRAPAAQHRGAAGTHPTTPGAGVAGPSKPPPRRPSARAARGVCCNSCNFFFCGKCV